MRRQEEEERYRRRDEARRRQEDGDIERLRQEQDRMAEQERLDRLRRANIPRQLRHQPTVQGESLDARADRFIRDAIGTETLRHMHQSTGQGSKGRSASSGAAHRSSIATANFSRSAGKADISSAQPKSEGASPKSGSPINIRDDVTPEDTSTSLSKISKHAHGPGERSFPLEKPVEEIQDHTYEQWIVDGILRDDSGERKYCSDSPSPTTPPTRIKRAKRMFTPEERAVIRQKRKTGVCKDCHRAKRRCTHVSSEIGSSPGAQYTELSDDVEPERVHGPSSDPESDLDARPGPIIKPRTGDCSSDDPETSEQTRTKINKGPFLPPVIYMLLVRVCGIVTRFVEPSPLPGRTRIRWRCQCGQMLYDDFIEVRPGALADLEQSLNSAEGFYECIPSSSNATSYASNRRDRTSLGGWLGSIRWPWKTASVQSPSLPLHEHQDALDRVSTQPPADNERLGSCIFLCIPYRRTANKLYPWVVEKVPTDNALFSSLRSLYKTAREEHISFLSLKTIKSIRFVRFEVYSQGLVDVRKTPDIPDESRRDEYSYHPMPAEFIPPIGEIHMMHLYTYPEEAEHTGICLGKIPKKIEGLTWLPTHSQGSKVGWGLHLVEGLDITRLWDLGFVGFMISIMFGIAWSMIKDDMQSGFAVAACMLMGLLFTTGMVQAAYEPK